ncbi:MAG: signal peptidase I [Planctomycetota bacterium]
MDSRTHQAGLALGKVLVALALTALVLAVAFGNSGSPVGSLPGGLLTLQPKSFHVSSEDMLPTLLPGDRVHVDMGAYARREPARGEVVVVDLAATGAPERTSSRAGRLFIGRVIGLPGDVVKATRDRLVINGEPAKQTRVASSLRNAAGKELLMHRQTIGAIRFQIVSDRVPRGPELQNTRIEKDRYLILGDYRTQAYDGRYWGTLHRHQLLGPATFVYFSREPAGGAIRWSRIGDLLR